MPTNWAVTEIQYFVIQLELFLQNFFSYLILWTFTWSNQYRHMYSYSILKLLYHMYLSLFIEIDWWFTRTLFVSFKVFNTDHYWYDPLKTNSEGTCFQRAPVLSGHLQGSLKYWFDWNQIESNFCENKMCKMCVNNLPISVLCTTWQGMWNSQATFRRWQQKLPSPWR